jgi:outer membrane receptor protein involved in Fe transport
MNAIRVPTTLPTRTCGVLLFALLSWRSAAHGQGRDSVPPDSAVRMSEIIVTATRSEFVRSLESPAAARTDTAAAADRAAGRVAADLLRDAPGVHVQQTSAGQGAVVLRGLVGNQVLLLVNGIPLNNGTYRDGPGQYLATIDPESIERIEVVRGPASVAYGSDAQGGVVNVITRPHPAGVGMNLGGALQASTGNHGARARLSAGYGTATWQARAGLTLMGAGDLRAGDPVGAQQPTGFDAWGMDARVDYVPSGAHQLTAGVQQFWMNGVPRYDRYWDYRAPALGPDYAYRFDPQARQLGYLRYAFRSETPAVRRLTATASLAVQRETLVRQRWAADTTPATRIEYARDDVYTPGLSLVGESQFDAAGRPLTLTWGVEGYRDQMHSSGEQQSLVDGSVTPTERETATGPIPSGRFPDGATMGRIGAFLEADAPLTEWLRLSAGGRWSGFRSVAEVGTDLGGRVENSAGAVTGQAGAVARIAQPLDLTLRLAQGFRAPNLYDLTNVGPVPGGVVVPNPAIGPERSLTYEAGLRVHTPATQGEVVVYRTVIDGFIDRVPSTFNGDTLLDGERVYQGQNVGDARLWGIEAEAAQQVGALEIRGTLLYTYGEQTLGDGTVEPMAKIPPLSGTAEARWWGPARTWWVAYRLGWATLQDRLASRDLDDSRIPPGGTPGFTSHALVASATVARDLTVSVGLENLTDELYRTHASGVDAPGRHVWMGLAVYGAP